MAGYWPDTPGNAGALRVTPRREKQCEAIDLSLVRASHRSHNPWVVGSSPTGPTAQDRSRFNAIGPHDSPLPVGISSLVAGNGRVPASTIAPATRSEPAVC